MILSLCYYHHYTVSTGSPLTHRLTAHFAFPNRLCPCYVNVNPSPRLLQFFIYIPDQKVCVRLIIRGKSISLHFSCWCCIWRLHPLPWMWAFLCFLWRLYDSVSHLHSQWQEVRDATAWTASSTCLLDETSQNPTTSYCCERHLVSDWRSFKSCRTCAVYSMHSNCKNNNVFHHAVCCNSKLPTHQHKDGRCCRTALRKLSHAWKLCRLHLIHTEKHF